MLTYGFYLWEIKATVGGLTAFPAAQTLTQSSQSSVLLYCQNHILRAGGLVAATVSCFLRRKALIATHEPNENVLGEEKREAQKTS